MNDTGAPGAAPVSGAIAGKESADTDATVAAGEGIPGLSHPPHGAGELPESGPPVEATQDVTRSLEILLKDSDTSYSGAGLKGIFLYSNKQYEAAIQEFDREIAAYPDVICATLLKVRALMHLGRNEEAFAIINDARTLPWDNYEACFLAAYLATELDKLEAGPGCLRHGDCIASQRTGDMVLKRADITKDGKRQGGRFRVYAVPGSRRQFPYCLEGIRKTPGGIRVISRCRFCL